jgi:ABC-2 type transport system ATP-binding protein
MKSDAPPARMITTKSLSKWYGNQPAVRDLDISVKAGSVVGFLGPNGAGKSTTLRMLSGFLPPTSGRAEIAGFDVEKRPREVRQRIGYLPESTPLYPEMRVVEYLRFRARLFRVRRGERAKAIDSVITRCWLKEVRRKPIGHLSKGYRQRVGLAAAMLHKPPVLLLDEPTAGLDPAQIREMRGLIRELAGDHTVLLSTHILPEVEVTCDSVIIIARGEVRAQGTLREIAARGVDDDRYVVEIAAAEAPAALRSLKGLSIVADDSIEGAWRRVVLRSGRDSRQDRREEIAQALIRSNTRLREVTREATSLEQMFIRLTGDAEAARPGLGVLAGGTRP